MALRSNEDVDNNSIREAIRWSVGVLGEVWEMLADAVSLWRSASFTLCMVLGVKRSATGLITMVAPGCDGEELWTQPMNFTTYS